MTSAIPPDLPPHSDMEIAPDDECRNPVFERRIACTATPRRLPADLPHHGAAPSLVGAALARMAWRVDHGATVGLLVCQTATSFLVALGLLAVTGTINAGSYSVD
ncbi:hypothetical protein [Streptomyces sp. NPDC048590]|uniref:hypothetical protein n=1 Tax=Streptomyces sp. NPDC048590 TaxID=3365574 RepID=UPI0037247EC5